MIKTLLISVVTIKKNVQFFLRLFLKKIIPLRFYFKIKLIYSHFLVSLVFKNRVICPCCKKSFSTFLPFGVKPRLNAQCPGCGSLERHRLLQLFLENKTNFFKCKKHKILDIAPKQVFQQYCKVFPNLDYISVDISSPIAMLKMDITNMLFTNNYFDCIFCYHVLEHIIDDQKAMRELFRILKPGRWAIVQSPIDPTLDKTFEDSNVILPEERERLFGQKDHVRIYGRDYKDRLEKAGFLVRLDNYVQQLEESKIKKYGLMKNELIFLCSKPK
jgi:SAM-dependent methyltransferase